MIWVGMVEGIWACCLCLILWRFHSDLFFAWWCQKATSVKPIAHVLFKSLLSLHTLTSYWPKHVTWQNKNPEWKLRVRCNEPQRSVGSREESGPLIQAIWQRLFCFSHCVCVRVYVCACVSLPFSATTLHSPLGYFNFALWIYFGLYN